MNNAGDDSGEYDPSWITGKALDRHFELQDTLFEFARLFNITEKNDRGLIIIGAAFLDTLLEHILVSFLIDDESEVAALLRPDGPLGTYGNRARAAYCMGLIPKVVRSDLQLVGKIRNRFAHDLFASFDDQNISDWSKALQWHRISFMQPPADASARDLFYVGVQRLVSYLDAMPSMARFDKRKPRK